MPSWSGKTRGGVAGYKTFVYIIKHFGLGFAYFLLFFVVFYFILTSPKAIAAAFHYFRRVQKYSIAKACLKIYHNYFVFGQTLIDKLVVMSGVKNKLRFSFDGEAYLHKMAEEKTGGMLMSAHIGSFEIAGYLLKRIDAKVNILMFEAEHENIKKYLSEVYKDITANIITIKEDMSHVYEIKKVFENKEFLCLHGDRFLEGTKTLKADFMGHTARFPSGPFYLAMKYNIPVSFVFAVKDSMYAYRFFATPPQTYYQEKLNLKKKEAHLLGILNDYIKALESIAEKYPEQWFNFYYFWDRKQG